MTGKMAGEESGERGAGAKEKAPCQQCQMPTRNKIAMAHCLKKLRGHQYLYQELSW